MAQIDFGSLTASLAVTDKFFIFGYDLKKELVNKAIPIRLYVHPISFDLNTMDPTKSVSGLLHSPQSTNFFMNASSNS